MNRSLDEIRMMESREPKEKKREKCMSAYHFTPRKPRRFPWKLVLLGTLAFGGHTAWQRISPADPLALQWGTKLSRNLDRLPTDGRLDIQNFPWADAPWTAENGGPLNRYQREDLQVAERFQKRAPHLDELKVLTPAIRGHVISRLSPLEIFDLVRGQSLYPLAKEVRRGISGRNASDFDERMNFGWAAAATMLQEPGQVDDYLLRLPTGHESRITIGSSDVKAVAAYYYGKVARKEVKTARVGSKCFGAEDIHCRRIDPASFHVLLTNMIRADGKSFVADIDPSASVDYRPIVGFETDIRRELDGYYTVTTVVDYSKRRLPQTKPYGIFNLDTEREVYRYTLEVDANREITRGDWLVDRHPEFVWRVKELPHVDYAGFSKLREIYREAPITQSSGLAGL